MYLSGVVIPDAEYDDNENIVVADAGFDQMYFPQQYGDDGVRDGAEGFGVMQARALKARLTRGPASRRRLGMGRHGLLFVGGSPSGLGVAPAVVAGAARLATGGRVLGVSFKKGRPRMFGGPLVDTVTGVRAKVEAGDLNAIRQMDRDRKSAKDKKAWQRIWSEVLPTWGYTAAGYTLIKQLDSGFPGSPPSPTGALAVPTTPTLLPSPVSTGTPAPAPASPVDAIGVPAPVSITQMPSPSPIPGGYAPTASEQVATASQEEGVQVQQAGMLGGLDLKNPMTMLMIGGIGLFVISQFSGSGKRSRRRRR